MTTWEKVREKLLRAEKPLTVADLEKATGLAGDSLSSLLLKKTKEGTLRREPAGPLGGYGYSMVSKPLVPTAYERLLGEEV